MLSLILTDNPVAFSFSPQDSDYLDNTVIMEQVVGTLVKYGSSGIFEPFLANNWKASLDEKTWSFTFKDHIFDENGNKITPLKYVNSLKKLLKIYSKIYSPPTFNQLIGWNQFLIGNEDSFGITVNESENKITFKFLTRPSGLLEFLSMPYYGYYVDNDFNGFEWKNKNKITSTGAYKVKHISDFKVELEARPNWFSLNEKSPKNVTIEFQSVENAMKKASNKIFIIANRDGKIYKNLDNYVSFNSTPTMLTAFVLSPFIEPFSDIKKRKAFRQIVRSVSNNLNNSSAIKKSNYFYNVFSDFELQTMSFEKLNQILKFNKKTISVFISKFSDELDSVYSRDLLEKSLHQINLNQNLITAKDLGKDWFKIAMSNLEFPIRIARVDIGGAPENWVINMMFCSKLGISFPDPNNKICELVHKFENNKIKSRQDYWKYLHKIIEDESIVIPVAHSGFSWLVSTSVNIKKMSPTMNIPRFDQIEILK